MLCTNQNEYDPEIFIAGQMGDCKAGQSFPEDLLFLLYAEIKGIVRERGANNAFFFCLIYACLVRFLVFIYSGFYRKMYNLHRS